MSSSLEKAIERGIEVVLFSFTSLPSIGTHYGYGIDEEELEKHWKRKLLLVADHEWALIGHTETTPDNAVLTKDGAITEMGINNLVLDITLYGQREKVDTTAALSALLECMAPLDELLDQRKRWSAQRTVCNETSSTFPRHRYGPLNTHALPALRRVVPGLQPASSRA